MNGTDRETFQGFVDDHAAPGAELYTDDASAYKGSDRPHYTVRHSTGQYVVGDVHTNGIESFWAMLKRSYHGVYHRMSPKHLHRYVNEIASRQNIRERDTNRTRCARSSWAMVGRRLLLPGPGVMSQEVASL